MSTWMVVEDEPDLYDTLLALFGIWSIDGVAFTNGTDAVKWIDDVDAGNAETNIPELAILDIRLPGVEGPEIGARLRQSRVLKNIAIVLVTAFHLSPADEKKAIEKAQADDLLYKPLPVPEEFRTVLQKAIAKRQALAAEKPAVPKPEPPPAVDKPAAEQEPAPAEPPPSPADASRAPADAKRPSPAVEEPAASAEKPPADAEKPTPDAEKPAPDAGEPPQAS
jgi:CheY-like chemotaxis protein